VDSGWRFDDGPGYVCGMVELSGANGFGSVIRTYCSSLALSIIHCFSTHAWHAYYCVSLDQVCIDMATLVGGFTNSVIRYHKRATKDTKLSKQSFTLDVDHTERVMVTIIGCLNDTCGL